MTLTLPCLIILIVKLSVSVTRDSLWRVSIENSNCGQVKHTLQSWPKSLTYYPVSTKEPWWQVGISILTGSEKLIPPITIPNSGIFSSVGQTIMLLPNLLNVQMVSCLDLLFSSDHHIVSCNSFPGMNSDHDIILASLKVQHEKEILRKKLSPESLG